MTAITNHSISNVLEDGRSSSGKKKYEKCERLWKVLKWTKDRADK